MGYVIAAILVVLIVGGFVLFLVTNAAKKSNVSDAGDPGADQNSLGIIGSDDATPLGSTSEHADTERATTARFRREESRPDAAPAVDGGEARGPQVHALTLWTLQGQIAFALVCNSGFVETNEMSRRTDALHSPAGASQPSSSVNGAPRPGAPFALRRDRAG